jgi:hypothetical protein
VLNEKARVKVSTRTRVLKAVEEPQLSPAMLRGNRAVEQSVARVGEMRVDRLDPVSRTRAWRWAQVDWIVGHGGCGVDDDGQQPATYSVPDTRRVWTIAPRRGLQPDHLQHFVETDEV